jgi:hypothetical protein
MQLRAFSEQWTGIEHGGEFKVLSSEYQTEGGVN